MSTQTPIADSAISLIGDMLAANYSPALFDRGRLHIELGRLLALVRAMQDAERFRDDVVRTASADAIATRRRAGLRLVTGRDGENVTTLRPDVTTLRPDVTPRPAGPFGGSAA